MSAGMWDRVRHRLELSLEWPGVYGSDATGAGFAAELRRRLTALAQALLPGHIELELEVVEGTRPRAHVDGSPLRLPAAVDETTLGDRRAAIAWIEHAVFANRRALASPSYAAQVAAAAADEGARLPRPYRGPRIRDLLCEILSRGLALRRALDEVIAAAGEFRDGDRDVVLERVLDPLYAASLHVRMSLRQHDAVFGPPADGAGGLPMEKRLNDMRDGLFYELGVKAPMLEFDVDPGLGDDEFRVVINAAAGPALPGLDGNGPEPAEHFVRRLTDTLRREASALLSRSRVGHAVGGLATCHPELVARAAQHLPVERLAVVLRALLAEGLSVRDLRSLLEAVLAARRPTPIDDASYIVFLPPESGIVSLPSDRIGGLRASDQIAQVRMSMRTYLAHKYTRGSWTLYCLLLDRGLEEALGRGGRISRALHESLIDGILEKLAVVEQPPSPVVLLTTGPTRPALRRLVQWEFPDLPVLSFMELDPTLNIRPLGRISAPRPNRSRA